MILRTLFWLGLVGVLAPAPSDAAADLPHPVGIVRAEADMDMSGLTAWQGFRDFALTALRRAKEHRAEARTEQHAT